MVLSAIVSSIVVVSSSLNSVLLCVIDHDVRHGAVFTDATCDGGCGGAEVCSSTVLLLLFDAVSNMTAKLVLRTGPQTALPLLRRADIDDVSAVVVVVVVEALVAVVAEAPPCTSLPMLPNDDECFMPPHDEDVAATAFSLFRAHDGKASVSLSKIVSKLCCCCCCCC